MLNAIYTKYRIKAVTKYAILFDQQLLKRMKDDTS